MTKTQDNELFTLYQHYATDSLPVFRQYCIDRITHAKKPNHQLIDVITSLRASNDKRTKDIILKKTDDFFLKGQGNGVI